MNDWNCNNSVSSNDAYIGKSMGSATMSPYHSDICFPSSPANQFHKLANTTMYSCSNKYPEDCGSSACSSSITNTPELESQTFNDTVYGNIQNAIDPTIYSSGQTIYPQQQLLMPLLTQAETLDNSQKVLSHSLHQPSFQNIDTVGVSYALHPTTSYYLSPIMSNAGTFEPPGRYATNYAPYVYYSNSTNHTSSNLRSTSSSSTPPPPYSYDHNYNMNFSNDSFVSNNIKYESQEENTAQNKCSPKINSTKISSTVFPCEVPDCNKTFSRPYNLKSHMRTHTLERPFACHYKPCAWKFARPHDLKRHELQHSGLKPHACSFCRRRFARSDALKRHWKVDTTCAQALREDITLNGGKVSSMANKRKKRSLQ